MSEQYRCNKCGYILKMKYVMCSECGTGYFEHLRWAKGGDGSHWEGCEEVHWDCRIAKLEKEIDRLKEDLAETQACLLERNIELDVERRSHRWIPVSERLPEEGEGVVVAVEGGFVYPDTFDCVSEGIPRFYDAYNVTHWMPLPEPPESA